jgi:predicted aconitase with swiveling domain
LEKIFKGRAIFPGEISGEAVVTHTGFNTLACYYKSILTDSTVAVCGDQGNPEIFGRDLTGKVICLPKSIGSTTAGATWDRIAKMGIAPKAMLFSQHIDSLSAAGLALVEVWVGKRICAVDQLGDEFLNYVKTGQMIRIEPDGVVTVE